MSLENKAQDYIDRVLKAEYGGKPIQLSRSERLQIAQIYAILSVAEQLSKIK